MKNIPDETNLVPLQGLGAIQSETNFKSPLGDLGAVNKSLLWPQAPEGDIQ